MESINPEPHESECRFRKVADIILAYLQNIIDNPEKALLDIECLPEAFVGVGHGLRSLNDIISETRTLACELAAGNLDCDLPPSSNKIAAPLKGLHLSLRHLTWQTQQVAKGNYNQRVEFMGAFSEAFNNMIMQLKQRWMNDVKEKNRLKEFLATMSHEIRTPMNAIIGIAQIELQKNDLPEEYASALDKIYNSSNSLLGIINDILDLSKIETGKLELNPAEYNVPKLIHDTVQLNIVRINSRPIEFILDINGNLPLKIYGDELRLRQILNNLLSNAIKYTDDGQVKLSVRHSTHGENIILCFSVEDTGQGMKPGDLERLFSGYLRFNIEANRTTEGTGIGLIITKNLVDMMGGTIDVKSEYGKGSVFTVIIRQKRVECDSIGEELAEQLRNFSFTGDLDFAKMQVVRELMPYGTVLIVDDVGTNIYVAEGLMAPYGLKIETAASGFAAIEKVENGGTWDIIFMDHMMPVMDGIETTRKLRGMGYHGAIVALTANALVGSDEMFKQNGFDDFISKPIDVRNLNAVLNQYIRDRHPAQAGKTSPARCEQPAAINHILLDVFRRDAENAIKVLKKTVLVGNFRRDDDMKLFITTVHAMKSALANIGENEKSEMAFALESAGHRDDKSFIFAYTKIFIKILETLIKN